MITIRSLRKNLASNLRALLTSKELVPVAGLVSTVLRTWLARRSLVGGISILPLTIKLNF
jgi:hypothetical protein